MVHEHEVTSCWSESVGAPRPPPPRRSIPSGSRPVEARPAGRRRPPGRVGPRPGSRATSRYSARDSQPGGQGQTEAELGPGGESLGVGQGQPGPAEGPLPHPGHVPLAGEADLAELGEAEADAHRQPLPSPTSTAALPSARGPSGAGRRRGAGIVPAPGPRSRDPARSPGSRRPGGRPRPPRARCRIRCRPRSRSRGSTGSRAARARPGRPSSPATGSRGGGRPRGGPRAAPRPRSGAGRRCPPGSSRGRPGLRSTGPRSKCSDHSWKVPPLRHTCSITAPIRRSPRLTIPSAAVAFGSCHRMVRPRTGRAASRSRWTLRVSSSMVFWPNHWNGVWTLGTNPPTEAVTVTDRVIALADGHALLGQGRRCRGCPRRSRWAGRSGSRA